jgi:hypothetical protein
MQTASRNVGPVDEDGEYGVSVTVQPVAVAPVAKRGQVIPEGATRRPMSSKCIDAADAERKSAMRAFFRTCCAEGLDCKAAERMRREISYALGRPCYSRRDVATGEWIELQTMVWLGRLAW